MATRLHDLQAVRGLACLLVVLHHAAEWERLPGVAPACHLLYPFLLFASLSVDVFFVLSGFILTWAHAEQLGRVAALPSYAARRLWRVYPPYWVLWLCLGLPRFLRRGTAGLSDALTYLLLLPRPGTDPFPQGTLQAGNARFPQSWTLVYELLFYALFAGFFLLPRRCLLPALVVWMLGIAGCAYVARPDLGFYAGLPLQPLLLEVLFGCLAATLFRRGTRIPAGPCIALALAWYAAGAALHDTGLSAGPQDPRHRVLTFGVPSALLLYGLAVREQAGSCLLPRWLRPLGDAAYSIYLTHVVVFAAVFKRTAGMSHRPLPHLVWVGLMVGSALALGYLFHLGVERPLLNCWRRRKVLPGLAKTPAPATHVPVARRQAA